MERKKVDDYFFGGLVIVTLLGGMLAYNIAQYGEMLPIFIWSINCGLIYVAGKIIEG